LLDPPTKKFNRRHSTGRQTKSGIAFVHYFPAREMTLAAKDQPLRAARPAIPCHFTESTL
jgi:hypothetical protein